MSRFVRTLGLFFVVGLLLPQSLVAAPKVVVSIAPLHSLVSGVMEGVAEPVLLQGSSSTNKSPYSDTQKLQLITADMVVLAGTGFERELAHTVMEEMPALQDKTLVLSNHVPLLSKRGVDLNGVENPMDRQAHRDLSFWMDPKLAVMAVRRIALKLSLYDPDNVEAYLDNEIKVVNRIKAMKRELAELLAPAQGMVPDADESSVYLSWRFQLQGRIESERLVAADASIQCKNLLPVSAGALQSLNSDVLGADLKPGYDLYFKLMKRKAKALGRCATLTRVALK